LILPADGVPLPALHFVPEQPAGRTVLFLAGNGNEAVAGTGGPIERLVREGAEVLAVDLRGFGETAMLAWRYRPAEVTGNNGAEAAVACMLGRPLAGMRTEDALLSAQVLARDPDGGSRQIELIGRGEAAIPALHAAALEPQFFASVQLEHAIDAWQRVVETDVPLWQLEGAVHGALQDYDLPDLVVLTGGRVTYVDPVDAAGKPLRR
jgi:pimeloyl-ACP methyl ester carboxylesterase